MAIVWSKPSPLGISNLTLIALLNVLIVFSIYPGDAIVPSLPNMASPLNANANQVQLAVSIFLFSSAIFQFICGFLTSSFGPKKTLMTSILTFTLGSLVAAQSSHIYMLWAGRFFQGIGAAAFLVMPRFYMKTCYPDPKEMGQISGYSMMSVAMTVALAPLIGGTIDHHLGWAWNFWSMASIGLIMFLVFATLLPSDAPTQQGPKIAHLKQEITHWPFLRPVLLVGLNLAIIMIYYTMSPFILEDVLHYSAKEVGVFGALSCIPVFIASRLTPRITQNHSPNTLITIGLSILLCGTTLMFALACAHYLSVWTIVPPFLLANVGTSLLFPGCFIEAFRHVKHPAIATGIYGTGQFILAASLSAMSALFHEQNALPMSGLMLGITGLAWALHQTRARSA